MVQYIKRIYRTKIKEKRISVSTVVIILFCILICALYIFHVVDFNLYVKEKYVAEAVIYQENQRIPFANNYLEKCVTVDGYYITVQNSSIKSFDECVDEYDIQHEAADSFYGIFPPDYVILVEAIIENESCNTQGVYGEGVYLWDFTLHGIDWYTFNDYFLLQYTNREHEKTGIAYAPVGESTKVTMAFPIFKENICNLSQEEMKDIIIWLNLTYGPQRIDVELDVT